jgi:hypothetical protein
LNFFNSANSVNKNQERKVAMNVEKQKQNFIAALFTKTDRKYQIKKKKELVIRFRLKGTAYA